MELKNNQAIIDWDKKVLELKFRDEVFKFDWTDIPKLEEDIWDEFELSDGTGFDINLTLDDITEFYEAVGNDDYTVYLSVYGLLPNSTSDFFNTNTNDEHQIDIVKTSGKILNFLREH